MIRIEWATVIGESFLNINPAPVFVKRKV